MRIRTLHHKQPDGTHKHSAIVEPDTRADDETTALYGTSLHDTEAAAEREAAGFITDTEQGRTSRMTDIDAAEQFQRRIAALRRAERFRKAPTCDTNTNDHETTSPERSATRSASMQPEPQSGSRPQPQSSFSFS